MSVSSITWNPGGTPIGRKGGTPLLLLCVMTIFITVYGQSGNADGQIGCDPMCTSSCQQRGAGRCDRACMLGWGLRQANWTCGQCESRCVTTCNIKGPGTCDIGCVPGYVTKDYNCVDFRMAITRERVVMARPYRPIEVVRSSLRAESNRPAAWSEDEAIRSTENQNNQCDPRCLVPRDARCAERVCPTACVPGYALVQWSSTNSTCLKITNDLLFGGSFGINTRWMNADEFVIAKTMLT